MSEQPPGNPPPPPGNPAPPPQNPYQPYGAGGPPGFPVAAPDHPQTMAILVLGIIGVAFFQICAPIAWYLGSKAKREIEASNGTIGGLGLVNVGRICGIVGTVILALSALVFVGAIAIIIIAGASST